MQWRLTERCLEREVLDEPAIEQPVADEVFAYLASVNRFLGGIGATIACFDAFSRSWRRGDRIEVLDVAAGGADVPRALVAWGRRRGFDLRVTAVDILPAALDYARRRAGGGGLRLVRADAGRLPFRAGAFDYVASALFFHHLADDQIVPMLRCFDRLARRGIVVNDLVRSPAAFVWTWLLTRPFHPVLRHDGPLSVRRALTSREMQAFVAGAGLPWLRVRRRFAYRMTIAGERPRLTSDDRCVMIGT